MNAREPSPPSRAPPTPKPSPPGQPQAELGSTGQQDSMTQSRAPQLSPDLPEYVPYSPITARRPAPLSSKPKAPAAAKPGTDTPPPSTMSALLQQQNPRDVDNFTMPMAAGPFPTMPPSPPSTRNSTASEQSNSKPTPPQAKSPPPAPPSVIQSSQQLVPRPSSAGSGVSFQDVRKVGKHLGQNPVDYLVLNGSPDLQQPVSQYFHPSTNPISLEPPPSALLRQDPDGNPVAGIFGNLNYLIDSYLSILSAGGSLAVGTGYRSVARRVLERVEGVFARDLCVAGVGWADVLEYVRGGRPRPPLSSLPVRGLLARREEETILDGGDASTTAKDLAESVIADVKEKPAMGKVEQWLQQVGQVLQEEEGNSRGRTGKLSREEEEEEDRILCEIIERILLDHAGPDRVREFHQILESGSQVSKARIALARLYTDHPSESITSPIAALYLLLHPELHPILQAVASITDAELDLINSGRFDSFLDGSTNVVARDEEQELGVIDALDKRLWSVLEGLEDEIEQLHTRALVVRRALKSRKENIQRKRAANPLPPPTSRSPSPVHKPLALTEKNEQDEEEEARDRYDKEEAEWAINVPSLHLPITPDDSASNIAVNRRRRKERTSRLDTTEKLKDKERRREKKDAKEAKKKADAVEEKLKPGEAFRISTREFGGTIVEAESEAADTLASSVRRKKRRDKNGEERRDKSRTRGGAESSITVTTKDDAGRHHRHHHQKDKDKDREKEKETTTEADAKTKKGRMWNWVPEIIPQRIKEERDES